MLYARFLVYFGHLRNFVAISIILEVIMGYFFFHYFRVFIRYFSHFQVFRGILIIYKFLKYFSIWMLSWCSGHLEDFKNVFMTLEIMSYCFLHVGFKRFVLLRYKRGFRFMRKEALFS